MEKVEASVSTEVHFTSMVEPLATVELLVGVKMVYAEAEAARKATLRRVENCILMIFCKECNRHESQVGYSKECGVGNRESLIE